MPFAKIRHRLIHRLGIGGKLQLAVGVAFVAGLGLVLAHHTASGIDATRAERHDANIRIVEALSGPASGAIAVNNEAAIHALMELLSADPRAAGLALVTGEAVAKTQQSLDHLDMSMDELSKVASQAARTGQLRVVDIGDYQFVGTPIKDGANRIIGGFGVGWSTKGLLDEIWHEALVHALAIAGVGGLILLILSISVRRMVTHPLTAIAGAMESHLDAERTGEPMVAAADAGIGPGYLSRADEIGALARALKRLRQHSHEMDRLNGQLDAALSNMSEGLSMFDKDQRLVICNAQYGELYRLPQELTKPGATLREIVEYRVGTGLYAGTDPKDYIEERLAWITRGEAGFQVQQLNDGRTISISHRPLADGGWVTTHSDITEMRRIEDQIAYMAHHDTLTDLPNRVRVHEEIAKLLAGASRGKQFAVLCLDLDRFKAVNDAHGHAVGDDLLKAAAQRLTACTRQSDMVGRLGGDEFVIIQVSDDPPGDAKALAGRICEIIAEPFDLGGEQVVVGVSIGIAIAPIDGEEPAQLLKNADLALYRAKSDGRGRFCFFEPEMDAMMQARREFELDLRKALPLDEFEVHYQPLVDLETGRINGLEALLRWNHPKRGMVPPDEFIPVAEEIGLILPLGEWVIRSACAEAAHWPSHVKVAVNLSPAQFRNDNLVQVVFGALAKSRIAAERLELEITESALLQDSASTLETLRNLQALGVRIAMDDFGTGYSSLGYLRSFPFDKIKIDRSFVSDLSEEQGESAIVNAVASMSRSLGMATTAEGVETEEQLRMVKAAGYSEMQGFLFSPPRRAEEIKKLFFAEQAEEAEATPALRA